VIVLCSLTDAHVPLTVLSDLPFRREQTLTNPLSFVTAAHVTPEGDGVVITARGQVRLQSAVKPHRRATRRFPLASAQVFLAGTARGRPPVLQLSHNPGTRYRHARMQPGGQSVVCLSDASGETEVVLLAADGSGSVRQITRCGARERER
jgi:hypothetical protein